jgi:uncharacterized membrane protein YfcA
LLGAVINFATVVIFVLAGAVVWHMAWVMIAGGIVGGYVGARLALRVSPKVIRALVSIIACAMTLYFFVK